MKKEGRPKSVKDEFQRISNSGVNKVIFTIEDQVQFSGIYKDSQTFDYKLNDKAAKSKLVKGAKRNAFEVEVNSISIL